MMGSKRLSDGVTGLMTLAVVCFAGTASARPSPPAAPSAVTKKCDLIVAGAALVCGRLTVALNRADPADPRRQTVDYVIIKSRSAKPRPDPVVFLTGGNGISAFYFLSVLARSATLDERDMIAIELRGNGYSEPNMLCTVGDAATPEAAGKAIRQCWDQLAARKVAVDHYTLTEAAGDVDDLRKALKIKEWNVYGTSHGSFWASQYLAMKPDGVRSILLDSPYPPQADPRDSYTAHLNGMTRVFRACSADPACQAAYPDLRARFVGLIAALDAKPVRFGLDKIDGGTVFNFVNAANFETVTLPFVPRLIDAMLRRDIKTVLAIQRLSPYAPVKGLDPRKASSQGYNINTACVDDIFESAPADRLALEEQWPERVIAAAKLSAFGKEPYCGTAWPAKPANVRLSQPVSSDVPALVTVGALDPETPPTYGTIMARTLSNGTLAVLPSASHAALTLPNSCTSQIIAAFLKSPTVKPDTACLQQVKPRFVLPNEPVTIQPTS